MRFALAHKTTTYLMLGFAFLAMLAGGGVPPVIGLIGGIGLCASWWWEAPRVRVERWTLIWTIGSVLGLVWSIVAGVGTGDWFGAAAAFLVWLVVAKAFNRRASKDWQQLHLLSFLMLVAGSVLNPGLSFGVAFLGFVVAATWALILSHLRREMEDNFLFRHDERASERVEVRRILDSRRVVDRRFFVGTGAVSLVVFAASAVLFVSIPRVGAGFFMRKQEGPSFVGFRDGVKLGGHGTLKDDPTIVMRVEVPPPYRGRDAPAIHWRGVAFDEYKRGEWRRSAAAPPTLEADVTEGTRTRRHVLGTSPRGAHGSLDDRLVGAVEQTVYLEPIDTDILFGASKPLAFEQDQPPGDDARLQKDDEIRFAHPASIRYTVWSTIEPPAPAMLRAARHRDDDQLRPFLQLPPEITDRTRQQALAITAGLTSDYDKATAIESWLRDNLSYTIDLADPGTQEPVDFFLFDRKAGHCEYFASAFAILARVNGLPTREVNGFLGGEWNEYDSYIAVRAGDAHSWDEVWFDGVGWVTFDATPASQDRLGRGGDSIRERLDRFLDSLRFQWSKWVIEYDLGRQVGLFKSIGDAMRAAGRWVEARGHDARRYAWWLAGLGLVIVGIGLARRRRRAGPSAPREAPRPRPSIAALYARVLTRLERGGIPRTASTTPRELAREVAARGLPFAAALAELTELYNAALWGGDQPADLLDRARLLADQIQLTR